VASQIMKTIRSWSKINVRITIGNAYPALNKLKKSYDEAKNALKILNTFPNMEDVAHISDLVLEQVLLDVKEETRELLIRESLYNLLSDSELLQTLQSFFHCSCNVTDTAKIMNLHRNTLLYRLQKIEELTGLNPKVFKDAMQLQIALLFIKHNVQNFG
jgi:carbohydrate diacid regulator